MCFPEKMSARSPWDVTQQALRITSVDASTLSTTVGDLSVGNSSSTALLDGETFTGTAERNAFPEVLIRGKTDTDGVVTLSFSGDGTNFDSNLTYLYTANTVFIHKFIKGDAHFRLSFQNNSGSNQTFFRFFTMYGTYGTQLTRTVGSAFSLYEDATTTRSLDTEFLIGAGLFSGAILYHKFGNNTGTDTGEDIWDNGGLYTFPSSASTLSVVSGSGNDTGGGSGARTFTFEGLDANYNLQTETVTLAGAVPAVTLNTFTRLLRAYVATAGASESNEGIITVTHGALTLTKIAIGNGQTRVAIFTVPAGYTAFVVRYGAELLGKGASAYAELDLYVRDIDSGVSRHLRPFGVTSSAFIDKRIYGALRFTEKTDLKFRCTLSSAATNDITVEFDVVMLPNS